MRGSMEKPGWSGPGPSKTDMRKAGTGSPPVPAMFERKFRPRLRFFILLYLARRTHMMKSASTKRGMEMSLPMRLLKKFASLRLTVWLLLWLAFLCVLGTIIPQHPLPAMPVRTLVMQVISLFSLGDVFHSLWFLIPTAVLGLNASVACTCGGSPLADSSSMPRSVLYEVTIPGEVNTDRCQCGAC